MRQRCPDLPALADGTGAAVLRWSVDVVRLYRICQDRQARLVDALPDPDGKP